MDRSRSIISADRWNYLDWFWKYYAQGGIGAPNIHLYYEPTLDAGSFDTALERFDRVIATLRDHAHPSHRLFVGEVGFPRAGTALANAPLLHGEFMRRLLERPSFRLPERVMLWRLFSDWLHLDCNDSNCDRLTATETTFGFINFRTTRPEPQMHRYFLPYGFWWSK